MRAATVRPSGAILALLFAAAPIAAGEIHWSYEWGVVPTVIHSDPVFYPLVVPPGLDREGMEAYRRQLEDTLNALTERAESAARTGRKPRALPTATAEVRKPLAA